MVIAQHVVMLAIFAFVVFIIAKYGKESYEERDVPSLVFFIVLGHALAVLITMYATHVVG